MGDLAAAGLGLIDQPRIRELRAAALASPQRRARICLHESHADPVQQMLIAVCNGSYIRPHKQKRNGKSYILLQGSMNVTFFDDDGRLTTTLRMTPDGTDGPAVVRFWSDRWHTIACTRDLAVYLEIAAGPYVATETAFAPWAPEEHDAAAAAFLAQLTCG